MGGCFFSHIARQSGLCVHVSSSIQSSKHECGVNDPDDASEALITDKEREGK